MTKGRNQIKEDGAQEMWLLAEKLAIQQAMAGEMYPLPHGGRLFRVRPGWQAAAVTSGTSPARCENLRELDAAVRNPDMPVVFLPLGAAVTVADIDKICQRHGLVKTVFWEGE